MPPLRRARRNDDREGRRGMARRAGETDDQASDYRLQHVAPTRPVPTLAEDVATGFRRSPRQLPPKYFYDATGSALFDRICELPEYYPTRTEQALLEAQADRIVDTVQPDHIIELGAGTARKTVTLLAACQRAGLTPTYWPFDVCPSVVDATCARIADRFPALPVVGLVGDYTAGLHHLPQPAGRCLYLFLGGTLGNFEPNESRGLLNELAERMAPEDRLLLGADRIKSRATLEAAYNDSAGVTAAFNRNVLAVINRELNGNFDPDAFTHRAIYNGTEARIEMQLRARWRQHVHLAAIGSDYDFAPGEVIRTEISRKFTDESLRAELVDGGLTPAATYLADGDYFSLVLARPAHDPTHADSADALDQ